jgi:hypothetical protein
MILPAHIKEKLTLRYNKSIEKYSFNKDLVNAFKMVVYNLNSGSPNKEGILEFIKANDEMDEHRKEKLLDVVPELKEVYEWAKS